MKLAKSRGFKVNINATLFDNADIYCRGEAERILGAAVKEVSGMREGIRILTKCGVRPPDYPKAGSPH